MAAITQLSAIRAVAQYRCASGRFGKTSRPSGVRLVAGLDAVQHLIGENQFSAISTWALSEMPLSLRERIEPILQRSDCRKILLNYQARFEGNDNRAYFTSLASRINASVDWMDVPIGERSEPASPFDSHYLFGMRR
jgi:hypothetical protein